MSRLWSSSQRAKVDFFHAWQKKTTTRRQLADSMKVSTATFFSDGTTWPYVFWKFGYPRENEPIGTSPVYLPIHEWLIFLGKCRQIFHTIHGLHG